MCIYDGFDGICGVYVFSIMDFIGGDMVYKIYEQFGDAVCYATEKGVIEVANNNRDVKGEIWAKCFTLEDAIKLLNAQLFDVEPVDGAEFNENYVVLPY